MFSKKKKAKAIEETGDDFFASARGSSTDVATPDRKNVLKSLEDQPEWIDEEGEEGQLSVDVYQEGDNIVVTSTIAGIEPEDIDISVANDMLTIRGERKQERSHRDRQYYFQECYWGAFSRSIILPAEVDVKKIDATIKNGILTVVLPKLESKPKKPIKVKEIDS